jgi:hypothetical protein
MTYYPQDYFDGVTGLLEQLALAVVTQREANQNYQPDGFTTDFVTRSVNWWAVVDNEGIRPSETASTATLEIEIQIPRFPLEAFVLTDSPADFTSDLYSVNLADVTNTSVNKKVAYPINSFPAKVPAFLSDWTSPNHKLKNTLERRIANLCLQIYAYKLWETRYNYVKLLFKIDLQYQAANAIAGRPLNLPDTAAIQVMMDALILELQSTDHLPLIEKDPIIFVYPAQLVSTPSNSAVELGGAYGSSDPASEGKLSSSIKSLLDSAGSSPSNFGTSSREPSIPQQKEQPTLSPC